MVQELRALCLRVLTLNIDESTQLGLLTQRDLTEVCAALSVDLPLQVALALPLDDLYWRRRTQAHYPPPHLALAGRQKGLRGRVVRERAITPLTPKGSPGGGSASSGRRKQQSALATPTKTARHAHLVPSVTAVRQEGSWKQGYLESHLAKAISTTQDTKKGWRALSQLLQVCGSHVNTLALSSLAPASHSGDVSGMDQGTLDHLNLSEVIAALPNLQVLRVRYQTVEEGGELRWADLGVSLEEAASLACAVAAAPRITHLSVYESCVDDTRAAALLGGLQGHPSLVYLDLRHNQLTCAVVPRLAVLLSSTRLATLHLQHNNIGEAGGKQLGAVLAQAPTLEALLLDLNPLGGDGGAAVLEGAARGGRLKVLSLAGCRLTDSCWPHVARAISLPRLRYVSLAANPFTQAPPVEVVKAAGGRSGARVLLTNLDGTTYLLGRVLGGRRLPPPLQTLHDQLAAPLTPLAAQEDLAHYLPIHGLLLHAQDFKIEEELRGMCLFTKDPKNII
ncbi:uncharacterized protein [Procambarus clarkii]|uniref:uncharacterized protein n=1 Tax=Procambarus clarkii TaxID=6728 RepID=UPI00374397C5